uniref:Uncharacterized protein n=1 Tax=Moniliophthora roreri TaxID=221103 RepID=A0A0W0GA66_MONRR
MFRRGSYWPPRHEEVKPPIEEPASPQMEEDGEVALQFELTEANKVVLMGYKLPSDGKQFRPEELAEAYVTAAYTDAGEENSESNRLIQQFLMGAKEKENNKTKENQYES